MYKKYMRVGVGVQRCGAGWGGCAGRKEVRGCLGPAHSTRVHMEGFNLGNVGS